MSPISKSTANAQTMNLSSDKMLTIMECLAKNRLPMRLQDIAGQVNMSQPTVLRYLNSLQSSNYVYQDELTSRYALTWKICRFSEQIESDFGLRGIATSFINELANRFDLGVCLVINQNDSCFYLDCIDNTRNATNTLQRIGHKAPLHATGSGKLLLTQYTELQLDAFVGSHGLERYTDYTLCTPEALKEELARVREQGYAIDEQECELGLRCVSVPLYNYSGHIIAAISIFGATEDNTLSRIQDEILPALKSICATISRRLGYEGE